MPARSSHRALGRADQNRLRAALDQLPPAIAYLRDPILAMAREDQELLTCGEADTDVIVEALRASAGSNFSDHATRAADQLRQWLETQQEANSKWAGPAWFVEGFLRGCELFQADLNNPLPPRRIPSGLERVTLDIPEGMKSKLYARGLELTRRGVQIVVSELDEDDFKSHQEAYVRPLPGNAGPHLRNEIHPPFQVGLGRGLKVITRHVESGLPVMIFYVLKFPTAYVQFAVFSKKMRGDNLEQYEPILASLRCK